MRVAEPPMLSPPETLPSCSQSAGIDAQLLQVLRALLALLLLLLDELLVERPADLVRLAAELHEGVVLGGHDAAGEVLARPGDGDVPVQQRQLVLAA